MAGVNQCTNCGEPSEATEPVKCPKCGVVSTPLILYDDQVEDREEYYNRRAEEWFPRQGAYTDWER